LPSSADGRRENRLEYLQNHDEDELTTNEYFSKYTPQTSSHASTSRPPEPPCHHQPAELHQQSKSPVVDPHLRTQRYVTASELEALEEKQAESNEKMNEKLNRILTVVENGRTGQERPKSTASKKRKHQALLKVLDAETCLLKDGIECLRILLLVPFGS
jgi:hypothetical protein